MAKELFLVWKSQAKSFLLTLTNYSYMYKLLISPPLIFSLLHGCLLFLFLVSGLRLASSSRRELFLCFAFSSTCLSKFCFICLSNNDDENRLHQGLFLLHLQPLFHRSPSFPPFSICMFSPLSVVFHRTQTSLPPSLTFAQPPSLARVSALFLLFFSSLSSFIFLKILKS